MSSALRRSALGALLFLCMASPAAGQYMKITTDNPTDNTRLRASGPTLLTLSLDSSHDRNGTQQTCGSHQAALCGGVATSENLDVFSYTIILNAVGGTVSWGTFTPADAAYGNGGAPTPTTTQVEINFSRSSGVTPAGSFTIGTIPVTVASGTPSIAIARGANQPIDPSSFGTLFGTSCQAGILTGSYLLGDPADPCGAGIGDWFDADGAGAAIVDNPPTLNPIANQQLCEGTTKDQPISGSDPDGDPLTFTKVSGPTYMTVATLSPTTGNIHFAPGFADAGTNAGTVRASDGALSNDKSFTITVNNSCGAPVLNQPFNMTANEGATADQTITGSDPGGSALTFTKVSGPTFMTVTTVNATTGNIHLAPGFSDAGTYTAIVRATNGSLSSDKTFLVTVFNTNRPPVLTQPVNMSLPPGTTADQTLTAVDPDGDPLMFTKAAGPSFMTVTTTTSTTGNVHVAPPPVTPFGPYPSTVSVSDGNLTDTKSFTINVTQCPPPVLTQPSNMTVNEGATSDQTLTATDACGSALTFVKVSGPSFMTVTTVNPGTGTATGNVHLAPGFADAGTYSVTVQASNGAFTNSKSFTISVIDFNTAPVLNPVSDMTVCNGSTADQGISGSDPQGDALTFTKTAGPTYMTVTTTTVTTGNIHLAPPLSTSPGTAGATVAASDGFLSASRSFTITIPICDRAPVLNQPANMTVAVGATADQTITGSDPDGTPLTFAKVSGPTFMTVTTTSATTGNIHLAASPVEPFGTSSATVAASDGILSDSKNFAITVGQCFATPVVAQPSNMTVAENGTADQTITATVACGVPLNFVKVSGPTFMIVTTTSPGTGTATGNIHLAPSYLDAGTYAASVLATTGAFNGSPVSLVITVTPTNRCPTSNPGPAYFGTTGAPVTFNGSGSSDPDGDPLTYHWDFDASDGITVDATGITASHAYPAPGVYTVTLCVMDNGNGDPSQACSDCATTTVTILDFCPATVFNGYDTIRLSAGKPFWTANVQPASGCYTNTDVVISSFVLKYAGRQIPAEAGKTSIVGDKNKDGIPEIQVAFSKDNLRALFTGTGLSNGHNLVAVTIEATLSNGGKLQGTTQVDIVNNGSFTSASIAPNPLNPSAILTYTTERPGSVRIEMFDAQGRLVRRLVDEGMLAAGIHEVRIDGERLASGVYYIRGRSDEGSFERSITILK